MNFAHPLRRLHHAYASTHASLRVAPVAFTVALLAACGGGGDEGTSPPMAGAYTIGGALSGLAAGRTVTLQNNAENDLVLSANGNFAFTTLLSQGVAYAVTIKTQPSGQRCSVLQGTGTATANVSNVQVRCENLPAATYTVGGAVTGLNGGTLVLQNNGGDALSITSNGGFTFATAVAGGAAYAVSVRTQPAGQSCTVRNGAGTVAAANVGSVEVSCGAVVALPEGDWAQELCVPVRPGQWGRSLWRITRQADNRVTGQIGAATYADANCSGAGTVAGPLSNVGNLVFDRSASTATLTAFWGQWSQPSGLTSRIVWARQGSRLCMLGDQTPTVFPTAASVESYVNTIVPNKQCYTQN